MKNEKIAILTEGAVMVALATVLSYVRIVKFPWGGSITLLSMLPIIVFGIRHGVKDGVFCAFVFSVFQFGQGMLDGLFGWGLTPTVLVAVIFCDYIIPFTILGFSGIFRKKRIGGWISGTVSVILLRFLCHYFSGVFIWHTIGKLWDNFSTENTYLYSLLYNGAYMLPELVFTLIGAVILFRIPRTAAFITNTDKKSAVKQ